MENRGEFWHSEVISERRTYDPKEKVRSLYVSEKNIPGPTSLTNI